jgi:hypothetical protein
MDEYAFLDVLGQLEEAPKPFDIHVGGVINNLNLAQKEHPNKSLSDVVDYANL